jgi:hypothetical protein
VAPITARLAAQVEMGSQVLAALPAEAEPPALVAQQEVVESREVAALQAPAVSREVAVLQALAAQQAAVEQRVQAV